MSAHAVHWLGEPALPYVRGAMRWATGQELQLLKLVELDIVSPPKTRNELKARKKMHNVSRIYHDPVIEFRWSSFIFLSSNPPPW